MSGRTAQTQISTLAGAAGIQTALLNHSNAGITAEWEGTLTSPGPAPTSAVYAGVQPMAELLFVDAFGNVAKLMLPAPTLGSFLADQTTIDPSAIADIIAAAIGSLITSSGNAVTAFVAGTLQG